MIELLKKIYELQYGNQKIDLSKIVRQKSSSYKKIAIEELSIEINMLEELESQGLVASTGDDVIILPLGFAYLMNPNTTQSINNDYELLRKIYEEQCKQIIEPLTSDNYSELDCSLGIFILLMGCISRDYSFPFIRNGKTYEYYNVIQYYINYISFRLFYVKEKNPRQLKNEVELRNILGRNDRNGNLIKKTKIHTVENDRGMGIKYNWFEISDVKSDVKKVLDGLFNDQDLISMLNLKKITMDSLLINNIPLDLKKMLGDRPGRSVVLTEVISYVNDFVENNNILITNIPETGQFSLNIELGYNEIKRFYEFLTNVILNYPKSGIYFVELHYRIAKVRYEYETNLSENQNLIILHYSDLLGNDFQDIIKECQEIYNSLKNS